MQSAEQHENCIKRKSNNPFHGVVPCCTRCHTPAKAMQLHDINSALQFHNMNKFSRSHRSSAHASKIVFFHVTRNNHRGNGARSPESLLTNGESPGQTRKNTPRADFDAVWPGEAQFVDKLWEKNDRPQHCGRSFWRISGHFPSVPKVGGGSGNREKPHSFSPRVRASMMV